MTGPISRLALRPFGQHKDRIVQVVVVAIGVSLGQIRNAAPRLHFEACAFEHVLEAGEALQPHGPQRRLRRTILAETRLGDAFPRRDPLATLLHRLVKRERTCDDQPGVGVAEAPIELPQQRVRQRAAVQHVEQADQVEAQLARQRVDVACVDTCEAAQCGLLGHGGVGLGAQAAVEQRRKHGRHAPAAAAHVQIGQRRPQPRLLLFSAQTCQESRGQHGLLFFFFLVAVVRVRGKDRVSAAADGGLQREAWREWAAGRGVRAREGDIVRRLAVQYVRQLRARQEVHEVCVAEGHDSRVRQALSLQLGALFKARHVRLVVQQSETLLHEVDGGAVDGHLHETRPECAQTFGVGVGVVSGAAGAARQGLGKYAWRHVVF